MFTDENEVVVGDEVAAETVVVEAPEEAEVEVETADEVVETEAE